MSILAGPALDAFSSSIDRSTRLEARASNLLFTVLIASSSGLWHAERWAITLGAAFNFRGKQG